MSYSSHIKHNTLKDLVLKDVPCEEKLSEIRKLLGMPQIENEGSSSNSVEEKGGEESEEVEGQISKLEEEIEVDERQKSIDRILEGFSEKSAKLAKIILREIEKSASVRWNHDNLEIVIDGEPVLHSNIKLLLQKILEQRSPTFPLGLHNFIKALIQIKLPKLYFRGSDAKNIREFLLDIPQNKGIVKSEEPGISRKREREGEEDEEAQIKRIRREVNEPEESPREIGESERGVKRSRSDSVGEDSGEEGVQGEETKEEQPKSKKRKKRVFEFSGEPPRRSNRKLKPRLGQAWSAYDDERD